MIKDLVVVHFLAAKSIQEGLMIVNDGQRIMLFD